MGGSAEWHTGESWSFFFSDRCSASHRDRLVKNKGCFTTRANDYGSESGRALKTLRVARIGNSVSVLPATPFGHAPQLNKQKGEHKRRRHFAVRTTVRDVVLYLAGFSHTIAQM